MEHPASLRSQRLHTEPGPDEAAGVDLALPERLFFVLVNSLILESRKYLSIQVVLDRLTLPKAHSRPTFYTIH